MAKLENYQLVNTSTSYKAPITNMYVIYICTFILLHESYIVLLILLDLKQHVLTEEQMFPYWTVNWL